MAAAGFQPASWWGRPPGLRGSSRTRNTAESEGKRVSETYRSGSTLARGLSDQSSVTMAPWLSSASQS